MLTKDFIYDQIYKTSLKEGSTERAALDAATMGLDHYRKGRFKKVSKLIEAMIMQAKKRKYA
jgi:hypothetical protein